MRTMKSQYEILKYIWTQLELGILNYQGFLNCQKQIKNILKNFLFSIIFGFFCIVIIGLLYISSVLTNFAGWYDSIDLNIRYHFLRIKNWLLGYSRRYEHYHQYKVFHFILQYVYKQDPCPNNRCNFGRLYCTPDSYPFICIKSEQSALTFPKYCL